MHRRKVFLTYPPNYTPGDGYKTAYSKYQALKQAKKYGAGASTDERIFEYAKPHTRWISYDSGRCWEYHGGTHEDVRDNSGAVCQVDV